MKEKERELNTYTCSIIHMTTLEHSLLVYSNMLFKVPLLLGILIYNCWRDLDPLIIRPLIIADSHTQTFKTVTQTFPGRKVHNSARPQQPRRVGAMNS